MTRNARVAALMMACAAIVVRAGQPPSGQPQTPTFRVAVDYVEVDVRVTDTNGHYIPDLNKEDFRLFEDGTPQTIANFIPVDIPVERATQPLFATHAIEPDVRTNVQPFAGRMYVMVLDAAHTLQNTPRTRAAARSFINEKFGANDLMAVVGVGGVGGGAGPGQEFTNNKRLLLAAVDSFRGDAPRSATLNRMDDAIRTAPQRDAARAAGQTPPPLQDDDLFQRERNARALVDELTAVADWLSVVHGLKKSIMLFSEGISYDTENVFQNGGNNAASVIQASMQDLVRAATKANAAIYAIDPRGLQGLADGSIELQGVTGESGLDEHALQQENRLAHQSLESFANLTGGFAVVNTNRMANAFDRILSENSSYYILAHYPPNPKRDGKYHTIDVRMTRPGVSVRFRRGYASPSGKAPLVKAGVTPELADAIQSPMPISGLGMMVFVAPFRGPGSNASVLLDIEVRGRDLTIGPNGRVDIAYAAIDQHGKSQAGSRDTLKLNLQPQAKERVEQTGMRLLKRLSLAAGRYQLRVAAHDNGSGAVGSVLYDLDVPDFRKPRLVMSGLVVTSAAGQALPTVQADPDLRGVLPGPPMAARKFARTDQITFFGDVYDNDVTQVHKVDITTSLTSDSGRVVFKNEEERSTEDLRGKPGGFGIGKTFLLSDFEPGFYVFRVEARSRLGSDVTASRDLPIQIVAPK